MTVWEMNAIVAQELVAYPRGPRGSHQNVFRSVYQNLRMNSLGAHPEVRGGPGAVEREALRIVQNHFPNFAPAGA